MRSAAPPIKCARSPFRERTSPPRANPVRSHHSSVAPVEVFHPTGQGRRNTGANVCGGSNISSPFQGEGGRSGRRIAPFSDRLRQDRGRLALRSKGQFGDDHDSHSLLAARPLEQGLLNRSEVSVEVEGCPDDFVYAFNWRSAAATSLRSNLAIDGKLQRLRYPPAENSTMCMSARGCGIERPWSRRRLVGRCRSRSPSKHARHRRMVGCSWRRKVRYLFPGRFRQPHAPLDCAVCPHRPSMGGVYRPQWVGLRRTHSSSERSGTDLQEDRQPRSGAAAARTHHTGMRCPLSRDRVDDALGHLGTGPAIGERDGRESR